METEASIRADILQLRNEIDRVSCAIENNALEEARNNFLRVLSDDYSDSYILYVLCNLMVPLVIFLVILLLYYSGKLLNERLLFYRLQRELQNHPVITSELQNREMTQVLRKAARRRTMFSVILKCIIGTSLVVVFVGSRIAMETFTSGWLKGLLILPETNTDANSSGNFAELKEEIFYGIMSFFSVNWFKDLQSLFLFSTIGSGVVAFSLSLLRSASGDVALTCTECTATMELLRKIDDQYTAMGREMIREQLQELMMMVSDKEGVKLQDHAKNWEDQEKMNKNEVAGKEEENEEEEDKQENEDDEKTNEKEKGKAK